MPASGNIKIKVAMVISTYYPVWGGMQRQLYQIGKYLKREGVDFFILTRKTKGTAKYESVGGVPVYRVFVTNRSMILDSFLYTFFSWIWLIRNRSRFDVLHCYQIFSPTTIGILTKLIIKEKKVIAKVTASNEFGEVNELKRMPFTKFRISFFKFVDRFLIVNESLKNELVTLGISSNLIKFVPNGVEIPAESCLGERVKQRMRESLKLHYEKIVIFTGRLSEEKNLDILLLAWQRVIKKYPAAHLIILGEGCKERNIQPKILHLRSSLGLEENVHLLGKVNNVFDYLLASDIFILPSTSEGLSNSLLEAMAAGLGIIAGDNPGNRQLVKDGINGILVKPGGEENIYSALSNLLGKEDYTRKLGENARQTVEDDFSMENIAAKYADIYRECLNEN